MFCIYIYIHIHIHIHMYISSISWWPHFRLRESVCISSQMSTYHNWLAGNGDRSNPRLHPPKKGIYHVDQSFYTSCRNMFQKCLNMYILYHIIILYIYIQYILCINIYMKNTAGPRNATFPQLISVFSDPERWILRGSIQQRLQLSTVDFQHGLANERHPGHHGKNDGTIGKP